MSQLARIRSCRCIIQFTRRIESDTGFSGIGNNKAHLRLFRQLHELCILCIGVQCTADNVNHCEAINNFAFVQSLEVYMIEIILRIQHVHHTFVDRLNNDYATIEIGFFVHIIDYPIYKCT